jgi:hypothetical protein
MEKKIKRKIETMKEMITLRKVKIDTLKTQIRDINLKIAELKKGE